MIRRLRRKFILINMLLVLLVLLEVFGTVCITTTRQARMDTESALRMTIGKAADGRPPKLEIGGGKRMEQAFHSIPVFWVQLDEKGQIEEVYGDEVSVSDEALEQIVAEAVGSGAGSGELKEYGLRYLVQDSRGALQVAFAGTGSEREQLTRLLLTSAMVGAGALAAFGAISLFLSRWALRPVELAWEQQRRFVADASHELKTPLTVILANMGILLAHREDTVEKQSRWVENTQEEAVRMKKLVDDLLFLARSDDGKSAAVYSRFCLSDAVWSGALPFEPVAFEQGAELQSEIAPELFMTGDEGQLRRLTVILLDNACKYAGKGGKVTLRLWQEQEKILLSVNNTGDPIPAEAQKHLFERFYRADEARDRKQGGYGLGLAIAKSIVENHGGRIAVESDAKNGTTFTALFPTREEKKAR
ncbi:MAG: HAMP domain-containing sensor histidine kinase [Oscillospiraceae bacterium]|nr:HAMP domain-containing sensor histidine kinase [Oscillospiraceae bacterium]